MAADLAGVGVVVRGSPGLYRDAVLHALTAGGATTVDPSAPVPPSTPAVAVLIRPLPEDWELADGIGARVVVVVEADQVDSVVGAVAFGADAVVPGDASPAELRDIVGIVARGGTVLHPAAARALATAIRSGRAGGPRAGQPPLTRRELEILHAIADGASTKQTSGALGIAPKTVENLQAGLFRKLGARTRAQAVAVARRAGLLG